MSPDIGGIVGSQVVGDQEGRMFGQTGSAVLQLPMRAFCWPGTGLLGYESSWVDPTACWREAVSEVVLVGLCAMALLPTLSFSQL